MTATTNRQLIDLMPQLRDILGLSADLDLPKLCRIECSAVEYADGYTISAQLKVMSDYASWDALLAWGRGAQPTLSEACESAFAPGGYYRKASVQVRVADVSLEVWTHVAGTFEAPKLDIGDRVRTPGGAYAVVTRHGCDEPGCTRDVKIKFDDYSDPVCCNSADLEFVGKAPTPAWLAGLATGPVQVPA